MLMKKEDIFSKINSTRLLWILFFMLLAITLLLSFNKKFSQDEFESIHASWKILRGEKIYVDFFELHHPLFYYMLVPIVAIFKETITTIIAARILVLLMLGLIFFVTYYISKIVFNKETGIISLILLSSAAIFVYNAIAIRPDVPQTLFGLISVLFLLSYFEKRSLRYLILSSLSLSISFLFLQKAVFLILIIGSILFISAYRKQIKYRDALVYLSAFIAPLVLYYIYLFSNGSLRPYLICNWVINFKWLLFPSVSSWYHFNSIKLLIESYKMNFILWAFWLLSPFFLKTANQKRIAILSLCLLISIFITDAPYGQYLMMAMPTIVVLSAFVMQSIFKENKNVMAVLLIISIVYPSYDFLLTAKEKPNRAQLQKIQYVLSITKPGDFVHDGRNFFNVFRKDLDFFWFLVHPNEGALKIYKYLYGYEFDIHKLIDKYKPKVILDYLINIKDRRIANYYVQSKEYEDLLIRADPY